MLKFDIDEIRHGIRNGEFKNIGNGTGRSVYDIGEGIVAKNAKNIGGIAQNFTEHAIYSNRCSNIFAKVYTLSHDGEILLMEKAKPLEDMDKLLEHFNACCRKHFASTQLVRYLSRKYKLLPADLCKPGSWGETENGLVLIDYGFTKWVSRNFYYDFSRKYSLLC